MLKKRTTATHHLFIDMSAGVAGDMLLAALLDLEKDDGKREQLIDELKQTLSALLTPETINLSVETRMKQSIRALGLKFHVPEDDWTKNPSKSTHPHPHHDHSHSHDHSHPHDHSHDHSHSHDHAHSQDHSHTHRTFKVIAELLKRSNLSATVKAQAHQVFALLAQGEATVHGAAPEDVHFHEVGSLDAICEVVGVCLLLEAYRIKTIRATPLLLGSGTVECAHGRMPVPVPAVTEMIALKQAPFKKLSDDTGELTTPTGAALVLALAEFVGPSSAQSVTQALSEVHHLAGMGWGAGTKTLAHFPNIIRVMLLKEAKTHDLAAKGTTSALHSTSHEVYDEVIEVRTSLDDVTGENLALLMEKLFDAGALDVHFDQVIMKKSRPGIIVNVIAPVETLELIGTIIFTHSPAIGYRYHRMHRRKLIRKQEHVTVQGIKIAIKISVTAKGKSQIKAEDDSIRAALKKLPNMTYHELEYLVKQAYYKSS